MKKIVFSILAAILICSMPVYADDILLRGDVNGDSIVNVRDAAYIAHCLAENDISKLDYEIADYNIDNIINVRDCADIARDLVQQSADEYQLIMQNMPKKPDKNKCDTKTYITEMIKYNSYQKYGITKITITDNIPNDELDQISWDIPVEFIPNENEYLMMDNLALPIVVQTDCDSAIENLMFRIESMIEEQKTDYIQKEFSDEEISELLREKNSFTLFWNPYKSKGNYQIYVIM